MVVPADIPAVGGGVAELSGKSEAQEGQPVGALGRGSSPSKVPNQFNLLIVQMQPKERKGCVCPRAP